MFKIGDKVRRIRDSFGGMETGDVATVSGVLNTGDLQLIEYSGNHSVFNFELVKKTPKKVVKRFGIADFMDGLNKK
jgi:hypothetical protein